MAIILEVYRNSTPLNNGIKNRECRATQKFGRAFTSPTALGVLGATAAMAAGAALMYVFGKAGAPCVPCTSIQKIAPELCHIFPKTDDGLNFSFTYDFNFDSVESMTSEALKRVGDYPNVSRSLVLHTWNHLKATNDIKNAGLIAMECLSQFHESPCDKIISEAENVLSPETKVAARFVALAGEQYNNCQNMLPAGTPEELSQIEDSLKGGACGAEQRQVLWQSYATAFKKSESDPEMRLALLSELFRNRVDLWVDSTDKEQKLNKLFTENYSNPELRKEIQALCNREYVLNNETELCKLPE